MTIKTVIPTLTPEQLWEVRKNTQDWIDMAKKEKEAHDSDDVMTIAKNLSWCSKYASGKYMLAWMYEVSTENKTKFIKQANVDSPQANPHHYPLCLRIAMKLAWHDWIVELNKEPRGVNLVGMSMGR